MAISSTHFDVSSTEMHFVHLGMFPVNPNTRYPKYITETDRHCTILSRDADFLRDKTTLTSEVPCFCYNFSTVSSSNNHLSNQTTL
jgi:hypothetical protein